MTTPYSWNVYPMGTQDVIPGWQVQQLWYEQWLQQLGTVQPAPHAYVGVSTVSGNGSANSLSNYSQGFSTLSGAGNSSPLFAVVPPH